MADIRLSRIFDFESSIIHLSTEIKVSLLSQDICKMSGWENGSDKFNKTKTLFRAIWRNLEDCADKNNDGKITTEEWVRHYRGQIFSGSCLWISASRIRFAFSSDQLVWLGEFTRMISEAQEMPPKNGWKSNYMSTNKLWKTRISTNQLLKYFVQRTELTERRTLYRNKYSK